MLIKVKLSTVFTFSPIKLIFNSFFKGLRVSIFIFKILSNNFFKRNKSSSSQKIALKTGSYLVVRYFFLVEITLPPFLVIRTLA